MKLSLILAAAFVLAFTTAPNSAEAQDSELRAKAKKLVDEGRQHQRNEQWEQAATKYRAAYDLVPHPSLLFNLGQVNRLGGDEVTALQFYRKFVAVSASGDLADDARRYIVELEGELGEVPFEDPLKPIATDPKDTPPPPGDDDDDDDDDPATAPSGGSGTLRIAGLATAGVGALLVGGGVYFGLRAKSLSDELSEIRMDAWTEDELQKDRDGRAANRNMIVLSIAGGVAIATGAVLYVLGRDSGSAEEATTATIVPTENADGMTFVVSGRF